MLSKLLALVFHFYIFYRWILTNKNIQEKLQEARAHLHLWEFYTEVSAKLDKYEEQYDSQLMPDTLSSCTMDFLKEKAENIKVRMEECKKKPMFLFP